jgi:hypothetical protein
VKGLEAKHISHTPYDCLPAFPALGNLTIMEDDNSVHHAATKFVRSGMSAQEVNLETLTGQVCICILCGTVVRSEVVDRVLRSVSGRSGFF